MRLKKMSRRGFVINSALSATGIMMASPYLGLAAEEKDEDTYNLMREVMRYRKLDAYATSNLSDDNLKSQFEFADRLGIEKLFVGMPMSPIKATPAEFREI